MTRYVIHNHLPSRDALSRTAQAQMRNNARTNQGSTTQGGFKKPFARSPEKREEEPEQQRDFRGVVNRDEEERNRDRMYKDAGIKRV